MLYTEKKEKILAAKILSHTKKRTFLSILNFAVITLLILSALLTTTSLTMQVQAFAAGTGTYKIVTSSGSNVNIRVSPGTEYTQKGSLPNGTFFEVSRISGNWGFIEKQQGWVCLDYASFQTTLTGLATDIADGEYHIETIITPKQYVDQQSAQMGNGGLVIIYEANGGDNQIVEIKHVDPITYKIKFKHSELMLEVPGGNTTAGTQCRQWSDDSNYCKQWYIKKVSKGYILINKYSGLALDLYRADSTNGSAIVQWYYDESDAAQIWKLIPTSNNSSELNKAIARAEEIVNFSFVPAKDFNGYRDRFVFKKGVRYYGLPYGQPTHNKQLLVTSGYTLDFFTQQVSNTSSLLYDGLTPNHPGGKCPYYSIDCSAYVSYILNVGRFTTNDLHSIASSSSNKDYYFVDYSKIKAGDILNISGSHMMFVYKVDGSTVYYYEQHAPDSNRGKNNDAMEYRDTRKWQDSKNTLDNAGYKVIRVKKING